MVHYKILFWGKNLSNKELFLQSFEFVFTLFLRKQNVIFTLFSRKQNVVFKTLQRWSCEWENFSKCTHWPSDGLIDCLFFLLSIKHELNTTSWDSSKSFWIFEPNSAFQNQSSNRFAFSGSKSSAPCSANIR